MAPYAVQFMDIVPLEQAAKRQWQDHKYNVGTEKHRLRMSKPFCVESPYCQTELPNSVTEKAKSWALLMIITWLLI